MSRPYYQLLFHFYTDLNFWSPTYFDTSLSYSIFAVRLYKALFIIPWILPILSYRRDERVWTIFFPQKKYISWETLHVSVLCYTPRQIISIKKCKMFLIWKLDYYLCTKYGNAQLDSLIHT